MTDGKRTERATSDPLRWPLRGGAHGLHTGAAYFSDVHGDADTLAKLLEAALRGYRGRAFSLILTRSYGPGGLDSPLHLRELLRLGLVLPHAFFFGTAPSCSSEGKRNPVNTRGGRLLSSRALATRFLASLLRGREAGGQSTRDGQTAAAPD